MTKKSSDLVRNVEAALEHFNEVKRKFKSKRHDENNMEVIDPRPMAIAVKYQRPPTLKEQLESFVRSAELRRLAEAEGVETFDEANDFDDPYNSDPLERFFNTPTPWEEGTFGQFEQDANDIRERVDTMVADAKKRREQYELDQKELEAHRKASKKPKGGTPPAGDPFEEGE